MLLYLKSTQTDLREHRLIFDVESPSKAEASAKKSAEAAKKEAEVKEKTASPESVTKIAAERAGKEIKFTSEAERKQAEVWERNRGHVEANLESRVKNGTLDEATKDFIVENILNNDSIPPSVKNLGAMIYMASQARNKQAAAKEAAVSPDTRLNEQLKLSSATDRALIATRTPASLNVCISAVDAEMNGLSNISQYPADAQPGLQVRKKVLEELRKQLTSKKEQVEKPEKEAKAAYEKVKTNGESNIKIAQNAGRKLIDDAEKAKSEALAKMAPDPLPAPEAKKLDEAIQKAREDAEKLEKQARTDAETNLKAAEKAYAEAFGELLNPQQLVKSTGDSIRKNTEEQAKKMVTDAQEARAAAIKKAQEDGTKLVESATKSGSDVTKATEDSKKLVEQAQTKGNEAVEKAEQAAKALRQSMEKGAKELEEQSSKST